MTTLIGCLLLVGVIAGGIYLYYKVEKLDREIDRQGGRVATEKNDDKS